ncbi:MAG: EVE domain-containing protein [Ignavibacteria bacterium]|nr:MAG: EVE domain-containing protein [Ignavibacteria bacterium]
MIKKYWLFKSEPNAFSIDDLQNSPGKKTHWDGVRNYQARNFIRDDMRKGDGVLFYHSNADPLAVVGYCEIVKEAYPDHTQFDPDNKHFDKTANQEDPRWYMVDIKFKKKFITPVTLKEIKKNPRLKGFRLIQRGNRLSVFPVNKKEWDEILKMGN